MRNEATLTGVSTPAPTLAPAATIRCFENRHYPAARDLWDRTPGVGVSDADEPDAIARFLERNPQLSFVATVDAQVVGTILCGHDGRRGFIHHLVVAADQRRRGLGRRLLQAGLSALQAEGLTKCHLFVFRDNDDGLAFWRSVSAVERRELHLLSLPIPADALVRNTP